MFIYKSLWLYMYFVSFWSFLGDWEPSGMGVGPVPHKF